MCCEQINGSKINCFTKYQNLPKKQLINLSVSKYEDFLRRYFVEIC